MPEPGAESVRRGQTQPAATQVLVEDGGTWWPADVLDQYRSGDQGRWRVVVRFTTEPGSTYLAMPADRWRTLETTKSPRHAEA
jgi:hypothetical protein